jgi:hypothetical protein
MASGNGFITYSPDSRYGSNAVSVSPELGDGAAAQKFTVPGSGLMEISEIGVYGFGPSGTTNAKMRIFTNNASIYPDSAISNSETDAMSFLTNNSNPYKKSFTYSTKPRVYGGTDYWLAILSHSRGTYPVSVKYSYNASAPVTSGYTIDKESQTYATWPSSWSTHNNRTYNSSMYAVYSQVPVGLKRKRMAGVPYGSTMRGVW